ncbi:MAG TPA: hypothetical protein DCY75_04115, partial [Clostridiales bacterium]|nr:hypothetical protein [Clostridiales bacterium]
MWFLFIQKIKIVNIFFYFLGILCLYAKHERRSDMSIKPTPKTKPIGYKQYAKSHAKKSPCLKNTLLAFLVGGAICTGGQGLFDLYEKVLHTSENDTGSLVSVTLIFLACFLTGVGIFDSI